MNPYPDLQLVESNVNKIVDILLERYKTAVSANGKTVFKSVGRGLFIPDETVYPHDSPFVRIWENNFDGINSTIQFFDREWHFTLSIFVGFHALPSAAGEYPDAQQFRNNLAKFALSCLQHPESTVNGIRPSDSDFGWDFLPEKVKGDHTAPMRSLGIDVPIVPPWYGTRLDVKFRCHNYP